MFSLYLVVGFLFGVACLLYRSLSAQTIASSSTPSRPHVLVRIYNFIFRSIGIHSTLSVDGLLQDAKKRANGADFEDVTFVRNLSPLILSLNTEAKLHPFGCFMTKQKLLDSLHMRLCVESAYRKFPEIEKEEILPPLFISGLARTGTTMLHRLFGSDRRFRVVSSWECMSPAPTDVDSFVANPQREREKRREKIVMSARFMKLIFPSFFAIHPLDPDQPEEEITIMDLTFNSQVGEALYHVPSYAAYLSPLSSRESYECLKKCLKLIQWQDRMSNDVYAPRRFVLKTPEHLDHFPDLADVFPHADVIQTHRSLEVAVGSFCSMMYHSWSIFSDDVDPKDAAKHWVPKIQRMISRALEFRRKRPHRNDA